MNRISSSKWGRSAVILFWSTFRSAILGLMLALASVPLALAAPGADDPLELLRGMTDALKKQNYDGDFIYAHGHSMGTLRIVHALRADGVEREKLEHMDGSSREVLRQGDRVTCTQPEGAEGDCLQSGPFSRAFIRDIDKLEASYSVEIGPSARVAGRDAIGVQIRPRDRARYGYDVWLDQEHGMLLKCLLKDESGEVLERFQFTRLEFPESIPDSEFRLRDDQRIMESRLPSPAAGSESGIPAMAWDANWLPLGFEVIQGQGPDVHGGGARVYSDGLAVFSVFVEPSVDGLSEGVARMGATVAVARKLEAGNDWFVTVVGEVPADTAHKVAQSVDFGAP